MKKVLRILLAIIIIITGSYTIIGLQEEQADNEVYENVGQYINDSTGPGYTPNDVEVILQPNTDEDFAGDKILEYQQDYDWDNLLSLNSDIVGWLNIQDNEIINFPVVKGSNNTFYLNHDYTKKYNGNGNAFLDYKFDKFCVNKIIYGHNMSLTSTSPIFTTITKWKEEEYFNSHRTLYYTEANGLTKKYLIVALAHFNVSAKEEHSYLETKFETEEDFRSWIEYIESHSKFYDLGEYTIDYRADEIIVLSTCDRKLGYGASGRSVLFCVNLTNNDLTGEG